MISFSCQPQAEKRTPTKYVDELKYDSLSYHVVKSSEFYELFQYVLRFQPSEIDISKDTFNDSLDFYFVDSIIQVTPDDSLLLLSKILLLKLNLYHLKRANQGYDLNMMRKGNVKIFIDYYLVKNNVDTLGEFLHSGIPFQIEKSKRQNNPTVERLLREIDFEVERLMRLSSPQ